MSEKGKFKSLSLGAGLVKEITSFLKTHRQYKSNAEFIAEAARLRMEDVIRLDLALDRDAYLDPNRRAGEGDRKSE